MKRSLNELIGYTIEAKDGTKGKVKDFLFDEETWIIRYLEIDLGSLLTGKKVLISQKFLKNPRWNDSHFPVELNKTDIDKSPKLDENLPVSRKYEEELHKSYQLVNYWEEAYVPPLGFGVIGYIPRPVKDLTKKIKEKEIDTKLRSFKEVMGYTIRSTDGRLGHIEDLIIDDEDWQVLYAIVDTKNWLPWSKKVMIGLRWLYEISYVDQEVKIKLSTDKIKNAPEYDPAKVIDEEYEKQSNSFYENFIDIT